MPDIVDPAVGAYADAHCTPPPDHLVAVDADTRERMPAFGMMVGLMEGRLLELLVHAVGARRVLEIGTFTGYSALSMAAGLPPGGTIITCEADAHHAAVAMANIQASPYAGRIEVRLGSALDTVVGLAGPFDFVFIDADKANYPTYYEMVLPKLSDGGLIAADNTLWSGRVLDRSDDSTDTVALRAFNDLVAVDPRVVCTVLTVRDGVTLIRKR